MPTVLDPALLHSIDASGYHSQVSDDRAAGIRHSHEYGVLPDGSIAHVYRQLNAEYPLLRPKRVLVQHFNALGEQDGPETSLIAQPIGNRDRSSLPGDVRGAHSLPMVATGHTVSFHDGEPGAYTDQPDYAIAIAATGHVTTACHTMRQNRDSTRQTLLAQFLDSRPVQTLITALIVPNTVAPSPIVVRTGAFRKNWDGESDEFQGGHRPVGLHTDADGHTVHYSARGEAVYENGQAIGLDADAIMAALPKPVRWPKPNWYTTV